MKVRLTARYVLSVAIVVGLVVIINVVTIFFLANQQNQQVSAIASDNQLTTFVRNFHQYIYLNAKQQIAIKPKGEKLLRKEEAWIQVLDEENREVFSYRKPEEIKEKHSPIEIINGYKYAGGMGDTSQILVGSTKLKQTTYTYLVGFPNNRLSKYIFIAEPNTFRQVFSLSTQILFIIDIIIAIVFGYLFSRGITKPVKTLISSVDTLYDGNYEIYFKEKGLYINVLKKLNALSNKLKANETERKNLDQMREEWIANISHDIKTPLSSIKGYAEFLAQDYDFSAEDIKQYAMIIQDKADYIQELVNDLNLNSQLKNKVSILNLEQVNLVAFVKNTVIDILNDAKLTKVDISFESSDEVIMVEIDQKLMKRVLHNLIYNAIFHNKEQVKIKVRVYQTDKKYIEITDNGVGIKEEELANLFNRYYRGTNTGEAHKGSGLGMAIAKEIVHAHHGEINIESVYGEGTTVKIML